MKIEISSDFMEVNFFYKTDIQYTILLKKTFIFEIRNC